MKRRILTPEEKQLWEQVTRGDRRLPRTMDINSPLPLWERGRERGMAQSAKEVPPHLGLPKDLAQERQAQGKPSSPARGEGKNISHGIDRNTAERFRKGRFPIDATLDLHGMSREKAHMALSGFLRRHYEQGSRCLLVVTGKGSFSPSPCQGEDQGGGYLKQLDPYPNPPPNRGRVQERRGVLREMLPGWLCEPGMHAIVLAFDVAQARHGGTGAYYVLLRRKRHG